MTYFKSLLIISVFVLLTSVIYSPAQDVPLVRLKVETINVSNPISGLSLGLAPIPKASLDLYKNGVRQTEGADYAITSNTITFAASSRPGAGDKIVAKYWY